MTAFHRRPETLSGLFFSLAGLPSATIALLFLLAGCASVASLPGLATETGLTGITGTVTDRQGSPVAGAYVYVYRSLRSGLRGPADFESRTDAGGSYFLDLVEGRYYLVARIRRSGGDAGPPRPGDAWALNPHNPVQVQAERISRVDFRLQGGGQPRSMKEGGYAVGDTGFAGRLVDVEGRPVPGAFVLAYRDGDTRRMPDATSAAVDDDGAFILYVPQAGRWCLAARTRTRGQPQEGELYAAAGERSCREVKTGEIRGGEEIVLRPFRR